MDRLGRAKPSQFEMPLVPLVLFFAGLERPLQGPDLVRTVFARATGQNGYEEYVVAASRVNDPAFLVIADYNPDRPPIPAEIEDSSKRDLVQSLSGMDLLATRKELVRRYGRVLDLVKTGNTKPVFDPRGTITAATLYPELAPFKRLARLAAAKAYVDCAEGNTATGSQVLMEGLRFSYNLSGATSISWLVGIASSTILIVAAQDILPTLSVTDAKRLYETADAMLGAPVPLANAMRGEAQIMDSSVAAFLKNPDRYPQLLGADDEGEVDPKEIAEAVRNLTPAQKTALERQVHARMATYGQALTSVFSLPEYRWIENGPDLDALSDDPNQTLRGLLRLTIIDPKPLLVSTARWRTQVRLLGLHARILEFRWRKGRLPFTLSDLGNPRVSYDPLANQPFEFQRMGPVSYRLYSRGGLGLGEVELKYQKPPDGGGAQPDEPAPSR